MALRTVGIAWASIVVALRVTALPAQDPGAFRISVETVPIYATVNDADGRLVTDLRRDDFQVRDNGRPASIGVFSRDPQPITVAVMLDMSGSMASRYLRVRTSTLHFIDALGPADRARLGTFGEEVFVSPLLTGDKNVLRRIVQEELWVGGPTPLWVALDEAMTSLNGEAGRRVILALTDGINTDMTLRRSSSARSGFERTRWPRTLGFGAVRKRAIEQGFMFYAIGVEGSGLSDEVVDLAEETGGGHFQLKLAADMPATFLQVVEELRSQYLLGIAPSEADGKLHSLDVRVNRPGAKVRARRNYLAERRR